MRVVILAFDGLEYDLVVKYRLTHFMQMKYGKVSIPKECYITTKDPAGKEYSEPWTFYVWPTILSGKLPKEIGISKETLLKWDNPVLQLIRVITMKIGLGKIKNKGKLFEKMGFKRGFTLSDYKCDTIFHHAKNPVAINVPTISREWGIRWGNMSFDERIKASWSHFFRIKQQTLNTVKNGEWDLLVSYTRILDVVGHIRYGRFIDLFKAYNICNRYVSEVKKLLDNNTICLVISDHGMKRFNKTIYGVHSDHGFYSINIDTSWSPHTMLDYYPQIVKWLKGV